MIGEGLGTGDTVGFGDGVGEGLGEAVGDGLWVTQPQLGAGVGTGGVPVGRGLATPPAGSSGPPVRAVDGGCRRAGTARSGDVTGTGDRGGDPAATSGRPDGVPPPGKSAPQLSAVAA